MGESTLSPSLLSLSSLDRSGQSTGKTQDQAVQVWAKAVSEARYPEPFREDGA